MKEKIIAKTDYTYCTNKKCKSKKLCARSVVNYTFNKGKCYSFANFDENNCENK